MIRKLIAELAPKPEVISIIGKVIKVSSDSVDVEPVNGDAIIYGVRLQASEKKASVLMKPKSGSFVIVTFINRNQAYVSSVSDIDSVAIKIGQYDVSDLISDCMDNMTGILDLINKLKVLTPAGPSTNLTPDSIAEVVKLKSKISVLKNSLKSIIKPL